MRGGATGWLSPELLDPEVDEVRPTYASDVYSFACVAVEVWSHFFPSVIAGLIISTSCIQTATRITPPRGQGSQFGS